MQTYETYSQFGEDIIADTIIKRSPLANKKSGIYIDIGACWPLKFSNTYMYYKRGWSGLAIDPRPSFEVEFARERPRDTCINCGISDAGGSMTYYMFENPVFNSFDGKRSKALDKQGQKGAAGRKIIHEQLVSVEKLQVLIDRYLPSKPQIDLVSVDVEGFEMQVLRSIDLKKHKPLIWIIELKSKTVEEAFDSDIAIYMRKFGYQISALTNQNIFFEYRPASS